MLGYVAHMWVDTASGVGVVAFANGFRGAWWLGEGALAIATGRRPPEPEPPTAEAAHRRRHVPARSGPPTSAAIAATTRGFRRS